MPLNFFLLWKPSCKQDCFIVRAMLAGLPEPSFCDNSFIGKAGLWTMNRSLYSMPRYSTYDLNSQYFLFTIVLLCYCQSGLADHPNVHKYREKLVFFQIQT